MSVIASVNLWSAMLDVADMDKPSSDAAKKVIEVAGQVLPCTELTLEVTEDNWIIRIHGIEGGPDFVVLTYGQRGHVAVETNTVVDDNTVVTKRVSW